ncbi:hypothetical protein [Longimicrobium sp.]|uniref:hypothetical protein n=1 Tax=Longimicrobium sp. TaxID=2029185 RepID=UPI003B3AC8A7
MRSLTLDLETGAIGRIRPHAPWTDLADWGRPGNRRPVAHKRVVYPEMGIAFLLREERVSGADLHFQAVDALGMMSAPGECEGFVPAQLRMVAASGAGMLVTVATTPDEIRARLGKAWEDKGAQYLGLAYERRGWELEFEFDADGVLSSAQLSYDKDGAR